MGRDARMDELPCLPSFLGSHALLSISELVELASRQNLRGVGQ
jgi:hypothetical protein